MMAQMRLAPTEDVAIAEACLSWRRRVSSLVLSFSTALVKPSSISRVTSTLPPAEAFADCMRRRLSPPQLLPQLCVSTPSLRTMQQSTSARSS